MKKYAILLATLMCSATTVAASDDEVTYDLAADSADIDTTFMEHTLQDLQVVTRAAGVSRLRGAVNGLTINKTELFKAACCNLGESFTTNPSVDVNYTDAATGARQLKLLGLSGNYVQMLTENLPDFRGSAAPYSLGYVPGAWMKSIQVSKGTASVKNGYEGITGQINVEYVKPEDAQGITANIYGDTDGKFEANADANTHINDNLSTELLLHFENRWGHHDDNHDGFSDMPRVRQYNAQNRWVFKNDTYIMHSGFSVLNENRRSGQTMSHVSDDMAKHMTTQGLYSIGIETERYDAYTKHAFVLNPEHGTNVAVMGRFSWNKQDARYGLRQVNTNEKNVYAQLMLEHNFSDLHNLSVGTSVQHDFVGQRALLTADGSNQRLNEKETVGGVYAQYTLNLHNTLVAMAGLRYDQSSEWGAFVTPRVHIKWQPNSIGSFRVSAGKGYRTMHALAENSYLLASSRTMVLSDMDQEDAWNYGVSTQLNVPMWGKTLRLNGEYYYTHFNAKAVVDFDSDPHKVIIGMNHDRNYSHVWQVDATIDPFTGMTVTAAYRRNIARETYGTKLLSRPMQSRYKALITASYKTPLEKWQFDATLQLNGAGRMPSSYILADGSQSWPDSFHSFEQVSAQITRWFRNFSIYVGGENLTGFKQKNPIVDAMQPWGSQFDTSMVWGPLHGAMFYAGIRINLGKHL